MLEIKNLSISINDRYLLKGLDLVLNKGDKLAIIGEEGNGKSTLLKAILGKCIYAKITGTIDNKGNKIGYLQQSLNEEDSEKTGFELLFETEDDYYQKVGEMYKYLDDFNLSDELLSQRLDSMSGGEKVKICILKLLLEKDDILFLDEPTNDLDIETLEWLEKFINGCNKPIMYVSHDETLLTNTANMILHLEQIKKKTDCRHTLLRIDYDSYVEQRLRKIDKQTQVSRSEKREYDEQQAKLRQIKQKVEYQLNTISRGDPHGAQLLKKKMRSVKAQEKRMDKVELTELPDVEESISFFFEKVKIANSKIILSLNLDELKVEYKKLTDNISFEVIGPTHLCIIGRNGVGKTTLMKIIYDKLKDRDDIKLGYMPQDYEDELSKYETVLDYVCPSSKKEDITKARMYLGNMKFTKEEMQGKISDISNGSKAKLFLIKLVLDKCDVLLLDEPTRNVSPLSNPVIRKVLSEFTGTIISISHDRKYIDEVANELYRLDENGLSKIR